MKKTLLLLLTAALALVGGCATNQAAYVEAQKAALVRESDARVAEAQAIAAIAPKLDAGGASAYAVMVAMRGAQGVAYAAKVDRPRDWIDGLQAVTGFVGVLGNVAVPIASIKANRDIAMAGYNRDVGIAQVTQAGETARMQTVANIATSIGTAPRPPTTSITVNAGGDSVVGSGSNVRDSRDCSTYAGHGAAGNGANFGVSFGSNPPTSVSSWPATGGDGGTANGGC